MKFKVAQFLLKKIAFSVKCNFLLTGICTIFLGLHDDSSGKSVWLSSHNEKTLHRVLKELNRDNDTQNAKYPSGTYDARIFSKKISFYKNFEAIDDLLRVSCVYGKVFTEPKDKLLMRVRSKEDHK